MLGTGSLARHGKIKGLYEEPTDAAKDYRDLLFGEFGAHGGV